jgi:hypothetical protein
MEELVLRSLRLRQPLDPVEEEEFDRPPPFSPGSSDSIGDRSNEVLGKVRDRYEPNLPFGDHFEITPPGGFEETARPVRVGRMDVEGVVVRAFGLHQASSSSK